MNPNVVLSLIVGLMLCCVGTVAQWPVKPDLRVALLDAIAAARLTPKEVYLALGYTQSHWSKIERGEASLAYDRLAKLPPAVQDQLMPRMAYVFWSKRSEVA